MKLRKTLKKVAHRFGIPSYWIYQTIWELRLTIVRMGSFLPGQRKKIRDLRLEKHLKLIFGVGDTCVPGWVGIDAIHSPGCSLRLDLRRKLPFPDECVDFCYSEHFLEHLTPEECASHLREVKRILKKGGRYRVVVPAARRFMERYLRGDDDFFRLAFPWAQRPWEAIYHVLNWNGIHRSMYDFAELKRVGMEAGFDSVIESEAMSSEVSVLNIDTNNPQRIAESEYVEMIRLTE